jgi:tetratricopeptide (TPR) repeat protein
MSRRARIVPLIAALALGSGCAVPTDGHVPGPEELLRRGELLEALLVLERARHGGPAPEAARELAAEIEERIRVAGELVQTGLAQRAEHRDEEAAQSFSDAILVWPRCDAAHVLLLATRARGAGPARSQPPASQPEVAAEAAAPSPPPVSPGVPDAAIQAEVESPGPVSQPATSEHDPHEERRRTAARTLSQRALVRYGRGELEEAIATWNSVLKILPNDPLTLRYLRTARKELAEMAGDGREARPAR